MATGCRDALSDRRASAGALQVLVRGEQSTRAFLRLGCLGRREAGKFQPRAQVGSGRGRVWMTAGRRQAQAGATQRDAKRRNGSCTCYCTCISASPCLAACPRQARRLPDVSGGEARHSAPPIAWSSARAISLPSILRTVLRTCRGRRNNTAG